MTLASSIIADAYRESNLIPMGNVPNANQITEALGRLNTLFASTIGNEAGDAFEDINIGGTYSDEWETTYFVPSNVRMVFNLSSSKTLCLHPRPFEGQRLSFVDAAGNLATYPVTIKGNGRKIEGATTLTLNTNSDTRQWFYRADLGSWVKITSLLSSDDIPFPSEFDDYFITMLALRLNPRYGQNIAPETGKALERARGQLRARYHAWKQISPDFDGTGLMNDPNYNLSPSSTDFNSGRPYRWR
jgi:hypothetical protein